MKLTSGMFMPNEAFHAPPSVRWSHIDGPLMTWAGQMHWLTLTERVCLRFRITTLDEIAAVRFTDFCRWHPAGRAALKDAGHG